MKTKRFPTRTLLTMLLFILISFSVSAHCDSMNGPVVRAAKKSLETANINFTLIWVKPENEKDIKELFEKVLKVRILSSEAKELAEMYFFETLVRLHRAGEGEPYTGIKSLDYKPEAGIEAADEAIEKNNIDDILNLVSKKYHSKVILLFKNFQSTKNYDVNNIEAGRKYVESYVGFIHYIEKLFGGENSKQEKHVHNH